MKERHPTLEHANMPATYTRIYLEWAQAQGIETSTLLRELGLPPTLMSEPTARIALQDHLRLLGAIITRSGNPGLGLALGWQLPLTAHGSLGYALLCCDTVGEALALLERFWHLRGRGVEFSFIEHDGCHIFEFRAEAPIPPVLKRVIFEFIMSGFYRGVQFLLGDQTPDGELWFDHPAPTPAQDLPAGFPAVRYAMPAAQIRFAGSQLPTHRIATANPEALHLAVAQCQREYALIEEHDSDILPRVRAVLTLSDRGYPNADLLAKGLHMSTRTLRRRLQQQGSSYQQQLETARHQDALRLLARDELPIQRIAELLGYTNPANFTRAFRRWTGASPREYRDTLNNATPR